MNLNAKNKLFFQFYSGFIAQTNLCLNNFVYICINFLSDGQN